MADRQKDYAIELPENRAATDNDQPSFNATTGGTRIARRAGT